MKFASGETAAAGAGAVKGAVVIVSPHFPPSTLAGVHRARHLANHLPSHGFRPIVVRASPNTYTEFPDPQLEQLVTADLEQVATSAIPASIMRKVGIGDIGLRAYPYLSAAVARLIEQASPVAVILTGAPFYPLLLSAGIKRRFSVPVIVDLQDPWVSNYGASSFLLSKRRIANELARILEPVALRNADFVTSVSEVQNAELRSRHSFLTKSKMAAVPIGGDPADFEVLLANPPISPAFSLEPQKVNLVYVGTYLPRARALMQCLFRALRKLASEKPKTVANLRLNFVGTSNQPRDVVDTPVYDLAREEGVSEYVNEFPRRVPYLDALALLAKADGLLMIGSDEPHYTASKIYPNLMAKRPYLSIFHAASSSHSILSSAGGGFTYSFKSAADLASLIDAVAKGLDALVTCPLSIGPADPASYEAYTAHSIAGKYAEIIDTLRSQKFS